MMARKREYTVYYFIVFATLIVLASEYYVYRGLCQAAVKEARLSYLTHDFGPKKEKIERNFRLTYQTIRTIGLLPGVRGIKGANRHNEKENAVTNGQLSLETFGTIQQLYNNLAKDVPVSEIYVVLHPFHPQAPTKEIPALTYDQLIVESNPVVQNEEAKDEDAPEEYEDAEYATYVDQLDNFSKRERLKNISLDAIPAMSSRELRTCDNSQYESVKYGSELEAHGFVYSVPFYDTAERLHGLVTSVQRKDPFEAILLGREQLLITHKDSLEAKNQHQDMESPLSTYALFNDRTGVTIYDRRFKNASIVKDSVLHHVGDYDRSDFFATKLNIVDEGNWYLALEWPENLAHSEINSLRLRALVTALVIIFFAFGTGFWMHNNLRQRREIKASHHRNQTLLENLGQGVLPIDRHGKITDGYTQVVLSLFDRNPEGLEFWDLLQIPENGIVSVQSWLNLVFQQAMAFDDLAPLGPHSFEKNGRVIRLEYRQILRKGHGLEKLLCLATDITRERTLQESADREREYARMVMSILKDREGFVGFISEVREQLSLTQQEMQRENPNIETLFRNIHTVKGLVASYHIRDCAKLAHTLENNLDQMRMDGALRLREEREQLENMLSSLLEKFEEFLSQNSEIVGDISTKQKSVHWDDILRIFQKLNEGRHQEARENYLETFVLESLDVRFNRLADVLLQIADKQGKEVEFKVISEKEIKVFAEIYQPFVSSWVHIFRNIADHGIETPDERLDCGKDPKAQVRLLLSSRANDQILRVEAQEDGRGMDPQFILKSALKKGIISPQDAEKLSDSEALQLIFMSGFSTAAQISETSGRGVGMEVLRYESKRLGGRAWVESELGIGSRIIAEVPIYQQPLFDRPIETRF